MTVAWNLAKRNFIEDDGSLPGIELTGLASESVRRIVNYFRSHGTMTSDDATLYDNALQTDVLLKELDDPAGYVLAGITDSFHCCFAGISQSDVSIPELGLFVFRDSVEIDYRMGAEWNPENVEAFFRLMAELKWIAPEATVDSAASEGVPYPDAFKRAIEEYTNRKHAEQD